MQEVEGNVRARPGFEGQPPPHMAPPEERHEGGEAMDPWAIRAHGRALLQTAEATGPPPRGGPLPAATDTRVPPTRVGGRFEGRPRGLILGPDTTRVPPAYAPARGTTVAHGGAPLPHPVRASALAPHGRGSGGVTRLGGGIGASGGTGRGCGGSGGSGVVAPPPLNLGGPVDVAGIIAAAIKAATEGILAAQSSQPAAQSPDEVAEKKISALKWLHLRMICGVATNAEIPRIWMEVAAASTRQEGLALLVQYLLSGMATCRWEFHGHADLLHVSIPLYNVVAGDRFVNPGENPACPAGGMSFWTSLQGQGDVGLRMAAADADVAALDARNAMADQIARASKVTLQGIVGASNLQKEIGTKGYILYALFGARCPLVLAYGAEVVDHIDNHFSTFERQMSTAQ